MNQTKQCILSFMFMLGVSGALAQVKGTAPVIGEPLPDFTFHVNYAEPGEKKLSALRGKPVILYFFGKGCVGSFYSLRDIQALYKQYRTKITFIAVAADYRDRIAESYERYRKHYDFELPVAIDSVVYKQLAINSFSTLILLDDKGVVRAITAKLSSEAIDDFLQGKPFFFHNTSQQAKEQMYKNYSSRKPAFVNGNGGSGDEFLQRSLISEWKAGMPRTTLDPASNNPNPFVKLTSLNVLGRSLDELYRIAYFGRSFAWFTDDTVAYGNYHFKPLLELRDSSLFDYDLDAGRNMFNYTQVLQPHMRTKENIMRTMQADLKSCFGYEVSVETRKMPYLRLIALPGALKKLKTIPGKGPSEGNMIDGIDYRNARVSSVISIISICAHLSTLDLPLLDETGITDNIDIRVQGVMTSLEDVTRALRTQGLDIVRGEREMKVIVIRDATKQLK